jgi:antitoxin component YwqK of YwqJK toxin-antitoxin module
MKKNLVILLVLAVAASCQPKYEQEVTEKFPDGTPKREQFFLGEGEDRYMAKDIIYYENGNKRLEGEYNEEGQKHGDWTYWYENGNKWSEGSFHEGLNHKERTTWHENGEKHYTGEYDKGERVGVWRFYDETGKLTKEIDYDAEAKKE